MSERVGWTCGPAARDLAGELAEVGGNYNTAFTRYQEQVTSFVRRKQATARNLASSFVPESQFRIILRDLATQLMVIPGIADALVGHDLRDDIRLPEYERLSTPLLPLLRTEWDHSYRANDGVRFRRDSRLRSRWNQVREGRFAWQIRHWPPRTICR
jgi:hypothetical protein